MSKSQLEDDTRNLFEDLLSQFCGLLLVCEFSHIA